MSCATTNTPVVPVIRATRGPQLQAAKSSTWFETILDTLALWQHRANQRHHLKSIEDRYLTDMGITRADADAEARKPFWKA